MGDRYANDRAAEMRGQVKTDARTAFLIEQTRLRGIMRAMADVGGFEAMKSAVELELRRGAQSYGTRDGWIG